MHTIARFPRYGGPKIVGERSVVHRGAQGYPDAFMQIQDPPETLYLVGNADALSEGLAIIGARKASPYGLACARLFAKRAVEKGIVIISGGALGCDSAAHRAAVEAGSPTVVFLGGGIDEVYPESNAGLFQAVVDCGGVLASENSWEYPALPHTFRARNRLIAGLARATLIVEAGLPSGTFSTADEALAANREVLVVPGSICSASSKGANRLLYQGATPVVDIDSFDDILFSLFGVLKQEVYVTEDTSEPAGEEGRILTAIRANSLYMEEILDLVTPQQGLDSLESLMLQLTELQRKGEIMRYPDGRFGPAKIKV